MFFELAQQKNIGEDQGTQSNHAALQGRRETPHSWLTFSTHITRFQHVAGEVKGTHSEIHVASFKVMYSYSFLV